MHTIYELFAAQHWSTFSDAVVNATGRRITDVAELRAIAHRWGLTDTVFRNEALEALRADASAATSA